MNILINLLTSKQPRFSSHHRIDLVGQSLHMNSNPIHSETSLKTASSEGRLQEQLILRNLFHNPNVVNALVHLRKQLASSFETVASMRTEEGNYVMDAYFPTEIVKMFHGLDIHSFQKAYSKFSNGIGVIPFVLLGLGEFECHPDHVAHFIKGMMELHSALILFKESPSSKVPKAVISFEDLITYFMKMQAIVNSDPGDTQNPLKLSHLKRFAPSNTTYDSYHHENSIKLVHYDPTHKLIFTLDDFSSHIRVYDINGNLKQKLAVENKKHRFEDMIINYFAWSSKEHRLCLVCQDQTISFFEYEKEGFGFEQVYDAGVLLARVWYIQEYQRWYFNDVEGDITMWDNEKKRLDKIDVKLGAKLSDIIAMPQMSLLVFAAFNHKLVFWNTSLNSKFIEIPLQNTSAHTLRFSPETAYLYVATFDQTAKVYQIDKSKDYTVVAKLDHTCSVTSLELISDHELVLTCDESGVIKSWDMRTLKPVQVFKLHNKASISNILNLPGRDMFVCVTNRLQYFHFGLRDNSKIQDMRALPTIVFDRNHAEIIVGTPFDFRVFNLQYGILVERYNKQKLAPEDKIENFFVRRSDKGLTYYTEGNHTLTVCPREFSTKVITAKLKPFPKETIVFMDYSQKYQILVCGSKNAIKFYKYEEDYSSTLLRAVTFPNSHKITSISANAKANYLTVVLNNMFIVFIDYDKCSLAGCYSNFEFVTHMDQDSAPNTPTVSKRKTTIGRTSRKPTGGFSVRSPLLMKSIVRLVGNQTPIRQNNIRGLFFDHVEELSNAGSPRNDSGALRLDSPPNSYFNHDAIEQIHEYSTIVENHPANISSALCIKHYNCCVLVDYSNQITLFEPTDLPKFKNRVRLTWEHTFKANEQFSVIKYKRVCAQPEANGLQEPLSGLRSPKTREKTDQKDFLMLGTSAGWINVIDMKDILSHYTPLYGPPTSFHPYNHANIVINEQEIIKTVEKTWAHHQTFSHPTQLISLDDTNCRNWHAHRGNISNIKLVFYTREVIVSTGDDLFLRIWNLKAEKLGEISLITMRCNKWKLVDVSLEDRVRDLSKVADFMEKIKEIYPAVDEKLDQQEEEIIKASALKLCSVELQERSSSKISKVASNSTVWKPDDLELPTLVKINLPKKDIEKYRREVQEERRRAEENSKIQQAILQSLAGNRRITSIEVLPPLERTQHLESKLNLITTNKNASPLSLDQSVSRRKRESVLLPGNGRKSILAIKPRPSAAENIKTNDDYSLLTSDHASAPRKTQDPSPVITRKVIPPKLSLRPRESQNPILRIDQDNSLEEQKPEKQFPRSSVSPPNLTKAKSLKRLDGSDLHFKNPNFKKYYLDFSNLSVLSGSQNPNDTTLNSEIRSKDVTLSSSYLNLKPLEKLMTLPNELSEERALFDAEKLRNNRETRHGLLKELDSKLKKIQNVNSSAKIVNTQRSVAQLDGISRRLISRNLPSLKNLNNLNTSFSPKLNSKDIMNNISFDTVKGSESLRQDRINEIAGKVPLNKSNTMKTIKIEEDPQLKGHEIKTSELIQEASDKFRQQLEDARIQLKMLNQNEKKIHSKNFFAFEHETRNNEIDPSVFQGLNKKLLSKLIAKQVSGDC